MSKHFEVTVLGSSIPALATAALLSRHGFRVLVIGMRHREPTYSVEGTVLARRGSTIDFTESPLFRRILVELGQAQAFARRVEFGDVAFQIVGDGVRFDVVRDPDALLARLPSLGTAEEVARMRAMLSLAASVRSAREELFSGDFAFPRIGVLAKGAAERKMATLPLAEENFDDSAFTNLPRAHPFRRALALFHRHLEVVDMRPVRAISFARAISAATSDLGKPIDNAGSVHKFFVERIALDGGEVRLRDRVETIEHDGKRVTALQLVGDGTKVHTDWLVSESDAASVLELLLRAGPVRNGVALPLARVARKYVLNVVARTEGVPPLLSERAVLLASRSELDVLVERTRIDEERERLTCTLEVDVADLPHAREAILKTLETHFPFIERHYELIDSPHDGRPLVRFERGARKEYERTIVKPGGGSIEREPMEMRASHDHLEAFMGDPLLPFLKNVLLTGESVVPGLGVEGGLLAALASVHWLKDHDPQKGRLRRKNWTKIEIG